MAKITIYTENYEETYGKRPKGNRTWKFFIVSTRGTDFREPLVYTGNYTEARTRAIREAVATVGGVTGLIVGV